MLTIKIKNSTLVHYNSIGGISYAIHWLYELYFHRAFQNKVGTIKITTYQKIASMHMKHAFL